MALLPLPHPLPFFAPSPLPYSQSFFHEAFLCGVVVAAAATCYQNITTATKTTRKSTTATKILQQPPLNYNSHTKLSTTKVTTAKITTPTTATTTTCGFLSSKKKHQRQKLQTLQAATKRSHSLRKLRAILLKSLMSMLHCTV